jgi:dTDP-4-amino-4,6-dideoxygalactose transaminase
MLAPGIPADLARFAIGFDQRDRERVHALWERIFDSNQWSEGELTRQFETAWASWNGVDAVALNGWTGAALAALEWAGVRGETVLCPSNTFMATPLTAITAGARVEFVDCNREDLCMSFDDLERKVRLHRPKAVFLVHIGGHLAFDSERIAELCRAEGIVLLEDCAHAHGAEWNGRRAGTFGDAGVWSFAATKTISTGEGGMVVSRHEDALEFARAFRNYGKPEHAVHGLNFRLNEFTAALGIVQVERLDQIVAWKNQAASTHLDPLYASRLHRLRAHRAVDRQGLRRAVPPDHGPPGRAAELGLGCGEPLVRPDLLPPRRAMTVGSTESPK